MILRHSRYTFVTRGDPSTHQPTHRPATRGEKKEKPLKSLAALFGNILTTDTPKVESERDSIYAHWGTTPAHLNGTPERR